MGFGANFIGMIKTLYRNAESTVMNGGTTTRYFPLQRAARQGDPISPLLFVLALEPLLGKIKREVKGIQTPKGWFKVSAYADDIAVGLGMEDEVKAVIKILNNFGKVSGLTINEEKCELLGINSGSNIKHIFQVQGKIKITGITFGEKKINQQLEKTNFEPALRTMRQKLELWKLRILSLEEKVLVIKSHALSQLQFLASILHTPDWVINEGEELIRSFLGKGQCRISKEKAAKLWKEGGVSLPMLKFFCKAAFVKTLTRARDKMESELWSANIVFEMSKIGMEATLHPQTDLNLITQKGVPAFLLSLIETWHQLQKEMNPEWSKVISKDSPICFNRKLLTQTNRKNFKKHLDTTLLRKQNINAIKHFFKDFYPI